MICQNVKQSYDCKDHPKQTTVYNAVPYCLMTDTLKAAHQSLKIKHRHVAIEWLITISKHHLTNVMCSSSRVESDKLSCKIDKSRSHFDFVVQSGDFFQRFSSVHSAKFANEVCHIFSIYNGIQLKWQGLCWPHEGKNRTFGLSNSALYH